MERDDSTVELTGDLASADGRASKDGGDQLKGVVNPVMAEEGLLTRESPVTDSPDSPDTPDKLADDPPSEEAQSAGKRDQWGTKWDFLLSIIGFAVDLANVWRFPYYCYKNGGGAFLIPYFTMLCLGALPLFYMEVLLGQFHKQGAISLWKIAPIFKGVGWTIVTVSFLVSFYYNTIIAWSIYYFFASFTSKLPWTTCDNDWNTCYCFEEGKLPDNSTEVMLECGGKNVTVSTADFVASTQEYFERHVLGVYNSDGLGDLGLGQWRIGLCLLLGYVILYFSTWKGVKTSGKVVYVTALMPYVILTILFIRGLMLEGAGKGLLYFIRPDVHRLADPIVWIEAAFQIFYSVGAGFGVHLAMASYNDFNNNCYRDCLVTAGVNSFTSLFSGCTVFIYLGYMSVTMNQPIEKVASQGPSLIFEVYPQAISTIPGSTAWSLLFFFMVIMLGMDSSMGGLESIATGIVDELGPRIKNKRFHREFVSAAIICCSMLFAVPGVLWGGVFYVTFMDNFAAGTSLLLVVLFEAVAIAWVYGLDQFCEDARLMLGFVPGIYWRICWKFVSPLFLLAVVVCSVATFSPIQLTLSTRQVVFPPWSTALGWLIVAGAFLWVPAFAVYTLFFKYSYSGSLVTFTRTLAFAITPETEHQQILDGEYPRRLQTRHWLALGPASGSRFASTDSTQLDALNPPEKRFPGNEVEMT